MSSHRFAQLRRYPVAVAAPALTEEEIRAFAEAEEKAEARDRLAAPARTDWWRADREAGFEADAWEADEERHPH